MKKNKEFTLEQYKKNVANNLNVKEKKLFKKLVKLIYKKGEPSISLSNKDYYYFDSASLKEKFKAIFPFLDIEFYSYKNQLCIQPKSSEKEYQTKIDNLNRKISELEKDIRDYRQLYNAEKEKVSEYAKQYYQEKEKVIELERKLNSIKNNAKFIGEISNVNYGSHCEYYLRDDIEITEYLYFDLANFYSNLGMSDMIKGCVETIVEEENNENNTCKK